MSPLSKRLVRLALFASLAALFSYERPAAAQIPVFPAPEAEPSAAPPESPPGATTPAAAEPLPPPPAAPEALPPPPVPPAGASSPEGALAPRKAAIITRPTPPPANADDDADDQLDVDDDATQAHWYGWQTLIADGASLSALLAGGQEESLVALGLLGYEFAPGIIHFAHRNPGRGFASFGIRLGMPLAGAFIGAALASNCNDNLCEAGGAAVGLLAGMGGAIAIDAAVFAYDDPKHPGRRVGLVPLVSLLPGRAWVGVAGQL